MCESRINYYYIMAFKSTKDAIAGEAYAKKRIAAAIMPLPSEISNSCGLALRFLHSSKEEILAFCETFPLPFVLYRMNTERINGVREVIKLAEQK